MRCARRIGERRIAGVHAATLPGAKEQFNQYIATKAPELEEVLAEDNQYMWVRLENNKATAKMFDNEKKAKDELDAKDKAHKDELEAKAKAQEPEQPAFRNHREYIAWLTKQKEAQEKRDAVFSRAYAKRRRTTDLSSLRCVLLFLCVCEDSIEEDL